MKGYLLDTHSFLWALFNPDNLGQQARILLMEMNNTIYVSSISFWEIALKFSMGKLHLEKCVPDELPSLALQSGFLQLPLDAEEAAAFYHLPKQAHKDPFDRMLIWQAISRQLILISKDNDFAAYNQYGLQIVW